MSYVAPALSADIAVVDEWSSTLLGTVDAASEFFRAGSTGWSPRHVG